MLNVHIFLDVVFNKLLNEQSSCRFGIVICVASPGTGIRIVMYIDYASMLSMLLHDIGYTDCLARSHIIAALDSQTWIVIDSDFQTAFPSARTNTVWQKSGVLQASFLERNPMWTRWSSLTPEKIITYLRFVPQKYHMLLSWATWKWMNAMTTDGTCHQGPFSVSWLG